MSASIELQFVQSFQATQVQVHEVARDKGWWDQCVIHGAFYPEQRNFGEAVALMHSELSEALENDRHGRPASDHIPSFSGVEEEFADVIIRIMDYAEANQLRVAEAILAKIEFNIGREHKHGGKKF